MKIAITGGIGSGKSFVCKHLAKRGIEVFDCDKSAKRLMRSSLSLQDSLKNLVGEDVYCDGRLQKAVLAQFILSSNENKQAVNDIVHPAVAADFIRSGLSWLESAILFESGFYKRVDFDHIVCVTAPESIRIERIMQRDNISEAKARQWIARQMPQEEVLRRSDFEIVNDGSRDIDAQIQMVLKTIEK